MSDTPEGNICKVSANLGWASDTLAEVDKALLKLSAEIKTILRERDEWKAKFIQANKDYGFELRDPCGTIWDHAKRLQAERDEARAIAKYWQEQFGHSNPEHEWQSFPWEAAK